MILRITVHDQRECACNIDKGERGGASGGYHKNDAISNKKGK